MSARSSVISPQFDERWRAYVGAHARIDHPERGLVEVQPHQSGRAFGTFLEPSGRSVHIMTAHNPGKALDEPTNQERQRQLVERLNALPDIHVWPAVGGDPTWTHTEESIAVVGLTEAEALSVADDFEQEAIFVWTADSWTVLSTDRERRHTTGWRLVEPNSSSFT